MGQSKIAPGNIKSLNPKEVPIALESILTNL